MNEWTTVVSIQEFEVWEAKTAISTVSDQKSKSKRPEGNKFIGSVLAKNPEWTKL